MINHFNTKYQKQILKPQLINFIILHLFFFLLILLEKVIFFLLMDRRAQVMNLLLYFILINVFILEIIIAHLDKFKSYLINFEKKF